MPVAGDRLQWQDVRLVQGPIECRIARIEVQLLQARFDGPRVVGIQAGEVRLEGVQATLPARPLTPVPGAGIAWHLEPLARLEGSIEAFITDAHWTVDADVRIPVGEGRIDFDRATVSHVGPDSSMGISPMGLYVDAPNGRNYLVMWSTTHVPGARFERRGGSLFGAGVSDRGAISIEPLVRGILSGVVQATAPHEVRNQLDRTRMDASLQLGDGRLGTDAVQVRLEGAARGLNRVAASAAVVGREVTVRVPELAAGTAQARLAGHAFLCGEVRGAVSVRLGPSAIAVQVDDLSAKNVRIETATAAPGG